MIINKFADYLDPFKKRTKKVKAQGILVIDENGNKMIYVPDNQNLGKACSQITNILKGPGITGHAHNDWNRATEGQQPPPRAIDTEQEKRKEIL